MAVFLRVFAKKVTAHLFRLSVLLAFDFINTSHYYTILRFGGQIFSSFTNCNLAMGDTWFRLGPYNNES
jgi:hypothetical protein